jgi:hypothetical protein
LDLVQGRKTFHSQLTPTNNKTNIMITTNELLTALLDDSRPLCEHYGLKTYEIDGTEYAIASDYDAAEQACSEYIKETVWAFNADFLASHIDALDAGDIKRLRGDTCESCNDALLKLIDDVDAFVGDAISADGLGHFLSPYDGEMVEIKGTNVLLFRLN